MMVKYAFPWKGAKVIVLEHSKGAELVSSKCKAQLGRDAQHNN
jgi:hypothetical protein